MTAVQLRIRDDAERRASPRRIIAQTSTMRTGPGRPLDVTVAELSRDGCQIACTVDLPLGTALSLGLAGSGMARGHVVRRDGDTYGCAFDTALTPEQLIDAFGADEVVARLPATPWAMAMPEPAIEPWPARTRVAMLAGVTIVSWVVIGAISLAL